MANHSRLNISDMICNSTNRFELLARIIRDADAKVIAEVGVLEGVLSEYCLENIPNLSAYYLIDPWRSLPDWNKPANYHQEAFDAMYDRVINKLRKYDDKIHVLHGTTTEVVDSIENESLDIVYIDADHTLRGISTDLRDRLRMVIPVGANS